MAVSALCCLVGLALSVISVLSIIGVARMDDEKSWTPRDSCQMFYQFLVLTAVRHTVVFTAMKKNWSESFKIPLKRGRPVVG